MSKNIYRQRGEREREIDMFLHFDLSDSLSNRIMQDKSLVLAVGRVLDVDLAREGLAGAKVRNMKQCNIPYWDLTRGAIE